MKGFEKIKNFYRPAQPAVKAGNKEIIYQEVRPEKEIEDFIYCFWQLKTPESLKKPFIYRVVSDGCIDIFFDHNQPTENFVMGFCRKYTEFPIGTEFDYIGIRFFPSAFPLLFGVDARKLSNHSQKLIEVVPDFSHWIDSEVYPLKSFKKITEILNEELILRIKNKSIEFDSRFFDSLIMIFENKGVIATEKNLATGLSPRQLRRIFNYYIGTTPKVFSNVVRFQHILNAKPSKQSLKKNKLYYDAGFFDQAHFIKDFKTFYGVTPTEAFQ